MGEKAQLAVTADEYTQMQIMAMKEATLEENVRQACKVLGLMRYHTYRSTKSPAGFVDDVIVGKWVMWRELKTQKGKLSPAQAQWMAQLAATGADVSIWRPSAWFSGQIMSELTDCAGRGTV